MTGNLTFKKLKNLKILLYNQYNINNMDIFTIKEIEDNERKKRHLSKYGLLMKNKSNQIRKEYKSNNRELSDKELRKLLDNYEIEIEIANLFLGL